METEVAGIEDSEIIKPKKKNMGSLNLEMNA